MTTKEYARSSLSMEIAIQTLVLKLSLFILASLCISLHAQTAPKQRRSAITRSTSPYIQAPITVDAGTQTLGPRFVGNDLRQIYEAIARMGIGAKGEFESSDEYATRLRSVKTGPIAGTISGTSRLSFVFTSPQAGNLEGEDPTGLYASYDPDKTEMSVSLFMTKPFQLGERPHNYFKLMDTPEHNHAASIMWGGPVPLIRYGKASNAFGARVTVTYGKYEEYGLKLEVDKSWRVSTLQDDPFSASASGTFQVSSNEAKIIKDRLRVLVICELSDDPIDQGQGYEAATITNPAETYVLYKLLGIVPKEFWVFDQGTGKVYLKGMELRASYPDQSKRY